MENSNESIKEIDLYLVLKNAFIFINNYKLILSVLLIMGVAAAMIQIKLKPEKFTDYYQSEFKIKILIHVARNIKKYILN